MFTCIKCNYDTTKKSDWNKHIITKKHKKLIQMAETNKLNDILKKEKPKEVEEKKKPFTLEQMKRDLAGATRP